MRLLGSNQKQNPGLVLGGLFLLVITLLVIIRFGHTNPIWAAQGQATFGAASLTDPAAICTIDHTPSRTGFFLLLTAGLLTGLSHCVGMCGPLVSAFTLRRKMHKQEISTPLVLYQTGRLTTYLLLGGIMGAVGSVLNIAAMLRGWQGLISFLLGGLLVIMGLSLLGWLPVRRWTESIVLARLVSGWTQRLLQSNHVAAPFGMGLANGLLPCGAVYAMSLVAAASGSAIRGVLIMLIFGLGTLPAMLGVGLSVSMLSIRLRQRLFRVAAILVLLAGVQLAARGLALSSVLSHLALGEVMLW